jgi:flagellar basal-body rod protein FlgC
MSFFNAMNTSASGLTAQRVRMDVISQNIANATTTRTPEGGPYRRKAVIFEPMPPQRFDEVLDSALARNTLTEGRRGFDRINDFIDRADSASVLIPQDNEPGGVRVNRVDTDMRPGPMVYDPTHPHANDEGYVEMPNVNIVYEMVNMMNASRSYEANITAINTTRQLIARTMEIGQAR